MLLLAILFFVTCASSQVCNKSKQVFFHGYSHEYLIILMKTSSGNRSVIPAATRGIGEKIL
jgi:hypothetical protein